MDKYYFFFDIDGTLTDNATKKIVPSAKLALEKLEAAGHFVAIATGRAHYKAKHALKELGIKNMVCNGGNAWVLDEQLIENIPLDKQHAMAILDEANDKGIGWLVAIDDSFDVYSKDDCFIQQVGYRKEPTRYIFDKDFDYHQIDTFYKIYLALDQKDEASFEHLNDLGRLRFEKEYLMYQPDNKKGGIIKMMNHFDAPLDKVVVFGDDYNDLNMFDPRWTSIAMGNGCQELKDKATYVAKANIDDGIYDMCIKMGWIDEKNKEL